MSTSMSSWIARWHAVQSRWCTALLAKRLAHPLISILLPLVIALAIAYPSIYIAYISPNTLSLSLSYSATKHIKSVTFADAQCSESTKSPDFILRSFTVENGTENLLNMDFISTFQSIQNQLTNGLNITAYSVLDHVSNSTPTSIIKSVQWYSKSNQFPVIDKISQVNGLIKAVQQFRIITYFKPELNDSVTDNINLIREKYSQLSISELSDKNTYQILSSSSSYFDILIIYLLIPLLLIYPTIKIYQLKSIKSKAGLLIAFIGQFIVSGFASISIYSLFSSNFEFLQIPFTLIIAIPLLVSVENISRLVISVNNYSEELSLVSKLKNVVHHSVPKSTNFTVASLIILTCSALITNSTLCMFNIIYVLFNFCLTYTYFITVLIVDFKKLQLRDLNINHINKSEKRKIENVFNYLPTISLIFILIFSCQWNTSSDLNIIYNKRGFVNSLYYTGASSTVQIPLLPQVSINYTYNFLYVFEFLSFLVFTSSTLFLILNMTIRKVKFVDLNSEINTSSSITSSYNPSKSTSTATSNNLPSFKSKELNNGHVLDVVKLCTSACPFIVSLGIDHKLLIWSPMKSPIPQPTELPLTPDFLPISDVVMSDSGSFITVFSKSGQIKCFSRLSMSWSWSITIDDLKSDVPLESFYRKRTQVSTGRRKLVSRTSSINTSSRKSNTGITPPPMKTSTETEELAVISRTPSVNEQIAHNSSVLRPGRSLSLDSNFDHSVNLKKLTYNSDMEFIIVLRNGTIYSINCTTGSIIESSLSATPLLSAKKLVSPRVNDRIVGIKAEDGELIVATAVNNKWKSRPVKIDAVGYNSGKSLITPAILEEIDLRPPKTPQSLNLDGLVIVTVPFVGMIVRAFGSQCQLVDVQTGIVLKENDIEKFKPSSFKVFHPEPAHCRFCGCASVPSFSIAYNRESDNVLQMHTFSIDNRAKNNICLRVERDSRETRCLGFSSVDEHIHTVDRVEGWCATYLNMLMGISRKSNTHDDENIINVNTGLRQRNVGSGGNKNSSFPDVSKQQKYEKPRISNDWQGWTLSADGQIRYYEIPDGADCGLLIKKLGPVRKFGHKSIVVSFGNVMKVLYLGNDNLIEEGESDTSITTGNPVYQSSNSLSFINRRRKLRMKKYDLTHSTNFEDTPEHPDEE